MNSEKNLKIAQLLSLLNVNTEDRGPAIQQQHLIQRLMALGYARKMVDRAVSKYNGNEKECIEWLNQNAAELESQASLMAELDAIVKAKLEKSKEKEVCENEEKSEFYDQQEEKEEKEEEKKSEHTLEVDNFPVRKKESKGVRLEHVIQEQKEKWDMIGAWLKLQNARVNLFIDNNDASLQAESHIDCKYLISGDRTAIESSMTDRLLNNMLETLQGLCVQYSMKALIEAFCSLDAHSMPQLCQSIPVDYLFHIGLVVVPFLAADSAHALQERLIQGNIGNLDMQVQQDESAHSNGCALEKRSTTFQEKLMLILKVATDQSTDQFLREKLFQDVTSLLSMDSNEERNKYSTKKTLNYAPFASDTNFPLVVSRCF